MEEGRGGVCRGATGQKEFFQRRNARVIYVFITTPHNAGTVRIRRVSTRSDQGGQGFMVHTFSGVSDPIPGVPRGAT
jgi:hypothetical protein